MIQVYVLVSFWDDNGLHKAGTFTEVKEENFDPYYMQKAGGSGDAYTKAETDALLDAKQDDLTAGTNIQISDQDVISATDTGDTVSVTQVQTTGTKIATVTVNSVGTDIYAPDADGGAFILHCGTNIYYLLDGQSYPNQLGFSSGPIPASDLENAVNAKTPVVIEFPDGVIPVTNIFIDADDGIKGSFVVGSDTNDGSTDTSLLKIITFQIRKQGTSYISMYVQDATPSGGGGSSVTQITILDSDMSPVNATDITGGSMSNLILINYDTSAELSYDDIANLCIAGKVYIKFATSQYALNEYAYGVIDSFGQPFETSPSILGLIHFTLIKSTGNANFKNVTLAYASNNKWNSTTW